MVPTSSCPIAFHLQACMFCYRKYDACNQDVGKSIRRICCSCRRRQSSPVAALLPAANTSKFFGKMAKKNKFHRPDLLPPNFVHHIDEVTIITTADHLPGQRMKRSARPESSELAETHFWRKQHVSGAAFTKYTKCKCFLICHQNRRSIFLNHSITYERI
jgi:hypothetical protein